MKKISSKQMIGYLFIFVVCAVPSPYSQEAPTFEIEGPIILTEEFTKEAGIAINTQEPEALIVTYDTENLVGYNDPITGEIPGIIMTGFFINTETLEQIGEPFPIFGNPRGDDMETLDVRYSPVTNQYIVVGKADNRSTAGAGIPLVAIVNPSSVASEQRIATAFAYDEDTATGYDDVALSVSTHNGNFLVTAERDFPETNDGEGAIGVMFDKEGNQLTPEFTRLDQIQVGTGSDVDDPDVDFLANNNVFLYLHNTDGEMYSNRVAGVVIDAELDEDGDLMFSDEQILSEDRIGSRQGHPAAIENPFTDELIGVFDYGNGSDGGDIFFFEVGDAPDYELNVSRDQIPYLEASSNDPINHRHPQLAVDEDNGVFILVININSTTNDEWGGILFTLLGPDGQPLPGNEEELEGIGPAPFYLLDPEETYTISNSANYYNIAYDEHSDSFIIIYATPEPYTKYARVRVTSEHGPSKVYDWMVF